MPSTSSDDQSGVKFSVHARQRAKQRSISMDTVEILLDYGSRRPAGGGAEIVHFTRAARLEYAAEANLTWAKKLRSPYAIVNANGVVITAGHRVRRVPRR